MPQMAPMNWLFLYILFISLFMLFLMKNYFFLSNNFKSINISSLKLEKKNWKW
uniref:ATP synthase complex subunit 8 n=1 Tax=Negha inflata TaxID=140690 RepID=A0A1S5QYL9_9NEOP|nr:ATP synthase F0 subunit 8 [Negha inflata]